MNHELLKGLKMNISEKQLQWGNTTRYCMNILLELDSNGKVKIEVIKHNPLMTTFGMPGYEEQMAFHVKMEKAQNKICKCLESVEQELKNETTQK